MPAISGSTTLAAVIGDPARHSLSPAIHNAAFAATDLDWVYVAFDVASAHLEAALAASTALGFGGLSVTMPHKTAVAHAVTTRSDIAATLDAVNCVVVGPSGLHGENTDGDGFLAGLDADVGMDVAGRSTLVIGAGGAARAVIEALGRSGAKKVAVHNRSVERAHGAAELAGEAGCVVGLDDLDQYDLIVNATPVGMRGDATTRALPCPVEPLGPHQVVVDLIYEPLETEWLRQARAHHVAAHNGLSMLIHQAALAFELWTGRSAPIDAMTSAARSSLSSG